MNWTPHAQARAQQRFATIDLEEAYARAKRVTPKMRRQIMEASPAAARRWLRQPENERFFLRAPGGIIFVMHAPDVIVTVFRLGKLA